MATNTMVVHGVTAETYHSWPEGKRKAHDEYQRLLSDKKALDKVRECVTGTDTLEEAAAMLDGGIAHDGETAALRETGVRGENGAKLWKATNGSHSLAYFHPDKREANVAALNHQEDTIIREGRQWAAILHHYDWFADKQREWEAMRIKALVLLEAEKFDTVSMRILESFDFLGFSVPF